FDQVVKFAGGTRVGASRNEYPSCAPAAAESLEEIRGSCVSIELCLHQAVLVGEQGALRVEHGEEIGGAGAVAQLRQAERLARLIGRRLQRAHLGSARLYGRQRILHLLERGEHGLPIGGDELLLAGLAEFELAFESSALEDRRDQLGGHRGGGGGAGT